MGQPRRIFNQDDRFLLFVLVIAGGAIFFCNMVSSMQDASFFQMLGLFFLLFMLYHAGRFAYKAWLKHGIRYAVTNQRVLILNTRSDDGPRTLPVNRLPTLIKTGGFDGVGTIMFGEFKQPGSRNRKKNRMPADPFLSGHPGFYDIHNVHQVYSILYNLQPAPDRRLFDDREIATKRKPTAADYEDRFGPLS